MFRNAGKTQTFNDYLPLTITTPTADFDGDGLSDMSEIDTYKTNPNLADTDGDQLSDSQEVLILKTNPNNPDSSKEIHFGQTFDRAEMCKMNFGFTNVD